MADQADDRPHKTMISFNNLIQKATRQCLCGQVYVPHRTVIYSSKKEVSRDLIAWIQQPIDLRPKAIKNWYRREQKQLLVKDHRFIPERHQTLGADLATAHFMVKRDAAVRFVGHSEWVRKDKQGNVPLPNKMVPDLKLEAVDASKTKILYTSFDNFIDLDHLVYLNLSFCPNMDDWCLDRLVMFRDTLLMLDLTGCPEVTEKGLGALHKLHHLQRLKIADMPKVRLKPLLAIMLEEAMPNCEIEGIDYTKLNAYDENMQEETPAFLKNLESLMDQEETTRRIPILNIKY